MKLIIEINLDNDSFIGADQDETNYKCRKEIASILAKYSVDLTSDIPVGKILRDSGGHRVGSARLEN